MLHFTVPGTLYFEFNGKRYPSGSNLNVTDLGTVNPDNLFDSYSVLVCMTSEVNTHCCRKRDGGNVGEWYFPDGSIVPRNRDNPDSDITRSGYTSQVRLNRRNNAMGPVGTYTCKVPDPEDSSVEHTATITLGEFLSLHGMGSHL